MYTLNSRGQSPCKRQNSQKWFIYKAFTEGGATGRNCYLRVEETRWGRTFQITVRAATAEWGSVPRRSCGSRSTTVIGGAVWRLGESRGSSLLVLNRTPHDQTQPVQEPKRWHLKGPTAWPTVVQERLRKDSEECVQQRSPVHAHTELLVHVLGGHIIHSMAWAGTFVSTGRRHYLLLLVMWPHASV